jgi:hypothetical protein
MKDGTRARIVGSIMHGAGLKKKYRCQPDDSKMKGLPTRSKK